MTSILKSSGSPTNTTRTTSFGNARTTIECEITGPSVEKCVMIEGDELVINEDYFESGRFTIQLDDDTVQEYKGKKGKTMKQTPVVGTRIIIIPKEVNRESATLAERWNLIAIKAKKACREKGVVRIPSCWVTTLSALDWALFQEIIAEHTLESKPHEFDEWMGKLWRSTRGLKAPRLCEDDEDTDEIKAVWKMASQNARRLRNRQSFIKRSAEYWNEMYHFGDFGITVEQ